MDGFVNTWISEMTAQTERMRKVLHGINEEQLNRKPAPDKWSAGELVDHLIVSNRSYFADFEAIGARNYRGVTGIGFKFIPRLLGKLIVKFITPVTKTKYKTVAAFRPSHSTHSLAILAEFEQVQSELIKRVEALAAADLDKTFIPSPASRFVIYSLRDALMILLNHEKRHIGQMEHQLP